MKRPIKVSIGTHNLSVSQTTVARTGVTHVIFNILKRVLEYKGTDIEFVPVFRAPVLNLANTPFYMEAHSNSPTPILEKTLDELGFSTQEIVKRWPYLSSLFTENYDQEHYERKCADAIAETDLYFEVSLQDIRNFVDAARLKNPKLKSGLCVYDLGPMKYPEFVAAGMDEWFSKFYIEAIRSADMTISISRHTAFDLSDRMQRFSVGSKDAYYAALPSPIGNKSSRQLAEAGVVQTYPQLKPGNFICSVATLEPRKNLSYLVESFWLYRKMFPEESKDIYLVLVGHLGWKIQKLVDLIQRSPENIILPGFVSNEDLELLYSHSLCVVLPSHYEGFGLPIAHARELGVPVITCGNSSLTEACALNASFVRPWVPEELACAIRQVQRTQPKQDPADDLYVPNQTWDEVFRYWCDVFIKTVNPESSEPKYEIPEMSRIVTRIGFDCSAESLLAKGLLNGRAADVSKHSDIWFAPRLTARLEANEQVAKRLRSAISKNELECFKSIESGSFEQLKIALKDSEYFVISSVVRLEVIAGIDAAVNQGLKLVALIDDAMLQHPLFEIFNRSMRRWTSLVICASPEVAAVVEKGGLGPKVEVMANLFGELETGNVRSAVDMVIDVCKKRDN